MKNQTVNNKQNVKLYKYSYDDDDIDLSFEEK